MVVRAQDNSVYTYLLQLSVAQGNNTTLTDVRVGGVTISGFDPEVTTYQYLLPRGTTVLPEVTYTPYDSFQTIRLTSGGVEGETRIVVRSQTGDMRTYSIQFMVDKLTDSALNGIVIGNDTLQGFHADSLLYQVVLASGTTQLPAISVLKRDESQMVTIQRGGVNGVTSIIVLAEDGSERTYLLQVSVMKSENALLDGILLDGVLIDGFDSQVFEYFVVLPDSATRCPEVSVVHAGGQSVVITSPRLTGAARIEVTPEEGAMNVYVVNFDFARSSVATLSDILLDGVSISGFESDSFLYNIVLPMGTESMPVISYVKGDSKQRVMEQVGNLFGANYLDVVAEDGSRNRYTIYFDMLRSSDATLLDIILDGVSINGFDANQTHYTYTLLPNSSSIPVLDYVKQNSRQNVELVLPVCEGVATLRVVAEDGVSEKTYEIEFAFAPFSNSALQGITLNGSVMSDFDADVLSYTIDVAANDLCPSVGYITADSTQIGRAHV